MDELILDICFLFLALYMIFVTYVIPIALIIVGIVLSKKNNNKKVGTILILIGSIYLLMSILRTIFSIIIYGF